MQKCSVKVKKAFSAEKKLRDLKKLFKSQRTEKRQGKKVKTNYLVKKQLIIQISLNSLKYSFAPQQIEKKTINLKEFKELYDFIRLVKV